MMDNRTPDQILADVGNEACSAFNAERDVRPTTLFRCEL
jgi:hypothetical protein